MRAHPPCPDWFTDKTFFWPCWKFKMEIDEIFSTLHNKFNTWPAPIQTWHAFHADVLDVSSTANTREELFAGLEKRTKQRMQEMTSAWEGLGCHLAGGKTVLNNEQWGLVLQLTRTKGLDAMLAFLHSFLSQEDKEVLGLVKAYLLAKDKRIQAASELNQPESSQRSSDKTCEAEGKQSRRPNAATKKSTSHEKNGHGSLPDSRNTRNSPAIQKQPSSKVTKKQTTSRRPARGSGPKKSAQPNSRYNLRSRVPREA
ncbi:hypothetical protein GGS20DRAFT_345638 [Poronia punctata]|nr:hypothetical protein GGS20DRAFT_345638 [Poronia punctata]